MARPTLENEHEIEQLSTGYGKLSSVLENVGVVSVHLRRMYKRHPQLLEIIEVAQSLLAQMSDDVDATQNIISSMLRDRQRQCTYHTDT